MQGMKIRRQLFHSPTNHNDYFELELPGAWAPPDSSRPLPVGKGEEARYGFLDENHSIKLEVGKYKSSNRFW